MLSFGTEITDVSETIEFGKRGGEEGSKLTEKRRPSKYIYYTVPKGGFNSEEFETFIKQNMSNVMKENGWVDAAVQQDFAFTPANRGAQVDRDTAPDLTGN